MDTGLVSYLSGWFTKETLMNGASSGHIYETFVKFYKDIVAKYGKVTHLFCDYGALGQTLTFGLNRYLQQQLILSISK